MHIRRQSIHARFTEVEVVLRYKSNTYCARASVRPKRMARAPDTMRWTSPAFRGGATWCEPRSLEVRDAPVYFPTTFLSAVTATPRAPEILSASRQATPIAVVLI